MHLTQFGTRDVVANLPQRHHDEIPFKHQRMRYFQVGRIDMQVIIKKDINIDYAVMVNAVNRLVGPPHFPFNGLRALKKFMR